MNVIACSGHRPMKLGGFSVKARKRLVEYAKFVLGPLEPDRIISGVAQGWDTAIALAANDMGVHWEAAVPFKGQEAVWPEASQEAYRDLLKTAYVIHYVSSPGYSVFKMLERNIFIVKWLANWHQSGADSLLLVLWDGEKGGTSHCIEVAGARAISVTNLWDNWKEYEAWDLGGRR